MLSGPGGRVGGTIEGACCAVVIVGREEWIIISGEVNTWLAVTAEAEAKARSGTREGEGEGEGVSSLRIS
jgi:type IV secretory pathway TrbD component